MAQTKKKRRRKHRGTQGGSISRNRPRGRPRTREEARAQARARVKQGGSPRDRPPTWRSAFNRALIMAGILFVLMALLLGRDVASSAVLSLTMLLLYVPAGYYLERFLYGRRQAADLKKRQAAARNS